MTVHDIAEILKGVALPVNNEIATQNAIETRFIEKGVSYLREHCLSKESRPDFMIDDVVIEVKIKGNRKSIFQQCLRYLEFENVTGLVLVTNKSIGDFTSLVPANKQLRIVKIGNAWL